MMNWLRVSFAFLFFGLFCLGQQPRAYWQSIQQNSIAAAGGATCGAGWTGPTSTLTHCWVLNDATSTIVDSAGSLNGTAGAGVTGRTTGPSGAANTAQVFNGTAATISFPSNPMAGLGSNYTILVWMNKTNNTSNDGSDQRWICWGTDATLSAVFANSTSAGIFDAEIKNNGVGSIGVGTISSGAWNQVGITYNGTTLVQVVNGSAISSAGAGAGDSCDANTYILGGRNAFDRLWAGAMARVTIYSSVLSSSDLTSSFNAQ